MSNLTTLRAVLHRALSVKRPTDGVGEAQLAAYLAKLLPVTMIDNAGNLHIDLRTDPYHRTLFTAHMDTVHREDGENNYTISTNKDGNEIWHSPEKSVLGADDGSGVAIIAHLIEAKVPALYILFKGEERGGIGSSWLVKNMPHVLSSIDRAVAFDRAGYSDIISHQGGARCASNEFCDALSEKMFDLGMAMMRDDGGVYTDTAEFTDIVPECTNLAVGYFKQHSDKETQDVTFLEQLAMACVAIDWDSLPTKRDPSVYETLWDHTKLSSVGHWTTGAKVATDPYTSPYGPARFTYAVDELDHIQDWEARVRSDRFINWYYDALDALYYYDDKETLALLVLSCFEPLERPEVEASMDLLRLLPDDVDDLMAVDPHEGIFEILNIVYFQEVERVQKLAQARTDGTVQDMKK